MYYDLTVITKKETDVEKIAKILQSSGAVVRDKLKLGSKNFAYPIKKINEGYFSVFLFETAKDKLPELKEALARESFVLRSLLLRSDANFSTFSPKQELKTKKPSKVNKPDKKPSVKKIDKKTRETEEKARKVKLEEKLGELLKE